MRMGEWFYFWNIGQSYFGNVCYLLLFLFAAVYLFVMAKKNKTKLFLVYISIVFVVFGNLTYVVLNDLYAATMYRQFWILPATMIIACVFVDIISKRKNIWERVMIVALFLLILTQGGTGLNIHTIEKAENYYGINKEAIRCAKIIEKDRQKKGTEGDVRALSTYDMQIQMRLYNAYIDEGTCQDLWYITERFTATEELENKVVGLAETMTEDCWYYYQLPLYQVISGIGVVSEEVYVEALKQQQIDYVVIGKGIEDADFMMRSGCSFLGETDAYVLYEVQ